MATDVNNKIELFPKIVAGLSEEITSIATGIFHSLCLSSNLLIYKFIL